MRFRGTRLRLALSPAEPFARQPLSLSQLARGHSGRNDIPSFGRLSAFLLRRESCCRKIEPRVCRDEVLREATAESVGHTQIELGVRYSLLGRSAIPLGGLNEVLRYSS